MANSPSWWVSSCCRWLGGIYYVLPRLTGARLWRKPGTGLSRAPRRLRPRRARRRRRHRRSGFGEGQQPSACPGGSTCPLAGGLFAPLAVNMLGTINRRREDAGAIVTLWFVPGGVAWLPFLYFDPHGGQPALRRLSLARQYSELFFGAGFVTLWVFTVGSGLLLLHAGQGDGHPARLAPAGSPSVSGRSASHRRGGGRRNWCSARGPDGSMAWRPHWAWPSLSAGAGQRRQRVDDPPGALGTNRGPRPGVISGVVGLVPGGRSWRTWPPFAAFLAVGIRLTALTGYWEAIEYGAIVRRWGRSSLAGVSFEALPRIVAGEPADPGSGPLVRPVGRSIGVGGVTVS